MENLYSILSHVLTHKEIGLYANLINKIINNSSGVQPMKMTGCERMEVEDWIRCPMGARMVWMELAASLWLCKKPHTQLLWKLHVLQWHLLGIATNCRKKWGVSTWAFWRQHQLLHKVCFFFSKNLLNVAEKLSI